MLKKVSFTDVTSLAYEAPDERQSYGDDPLHFVEHWISPEASDSILFIHGGCWLSDFDASHARPLCSELRKLGYSVWSLEFRRIGNPGGGWPGTFADVMAGLKYVYEKHKNQPSPGRFIIAGHSAGGHLALWATTCLTCHAQNSLDIDISLTVGLAAISDIHTYAKGDSPCEKATITLMGGTPEAQPQRYEEASPLFLAKSAATDHIALLHGSEDQIVAPEQSAHFAEQTDARHIIVEGGGHFDVIHPGSIAFPQFVELLRAT